jgi:hemoglobin
VTTSPTTTATLHERLTRFAGTEEVFSVVAERLYDRILGPVTGNPDLDGDVSLVAYFRDPDGSAVDRRRLERHLAHFLAAALGGPQRYSGRGMAVAHAGRGITDEAFDRVVGHVVAVLESLGVPAAWIAEVGEAVEPLREQVVTVRAAAAP